MSQKKNKEKELAEKITVETLYALKCKKCGNLLRMKKSSNEGSDFCNEFTVRLEHYCKESDWDLDLDIWYIDEAYNAEYVRQFSTEWYNSGERCPKHGFKPEELEVVEVHRVVTTKTVHVKVPTFMEYMELKYAKKEPDHFNYIKSEYEKRPHGWSYSLYELLELTSNGKWKPEGDTDGTDN